MNYHTLIRNSIRALSINASSSSISSYESCAILETKPPHSKLEKATQFFTTLNQIHFVGSAHSMTTYQNVVKKDSHLPQVSMFSLHIQSDGS
jgi:hypothetical protein